MARRISIFYIYIAALLTGLSGITITYGDLLTVPENTVVKLGDRVEFECSTNETSQKEIPLDWTFISATSKKKYSIYEGGIITKACSSKYEVENTTRGGYNLIMRSVDLSFGGTYSCTRFESDEEPQSSALSELIVIASDPVCSTNASAIIKEGDYIQMWCTVNYSGNWIPAMDWIASNVDTAEANITFWCTSTTATSAFTTQLNLNNTGVTFMCKTCFTPNTTNICKTLGPDAVCANNTSQYQHLWNYTAFISLDNNNHATDPDNALFVIVGISVGAVVLFIATSMIICKLCKRDTPKPDVVPVEQVEQVEQNNSDTSDRSQLQENFPLYGEVLRNSNGFHIVENQPMPVYASVKKERIVGEMNKQPAANDYQRNQKIPVYAEVKKMENEKKMNVPNGQILLPTDTKLKQNYTGADGTQYMELESLAELSSIGIPEKRRPLFNLVETYASIDHTLAAPPPPPLLVPRRH